MPRNVKDIIAKLPESRRKSIMDAADAMYVEEMTLAELRQARFSSQAKLAEKLGIKQAALSRLERRSDMHISKLRQLIAGMGGTMKIVVRFPGRDPVSVNLFDALGSRAGVKESRRKKSGAASEKESLIETFPIAVSEKEWSVVPKPRDLPSRRRITEKPTKTKHKTKRSKT
jgi:transcriptional regulator with XRE-family HTH domain